MAILNWQSDRRSNKCAKGMVREVARIVGVAEI